jgi:hypothetical protein
LVAVADPQQERWRVAVHEAAHVVIAMDVGGGMARVRLSEVGGTTHERAGPRHRSLPFRTAPVAAAGELAEAKFAASLGWSPPPATAAASDQARVAACARSLALDENVLRADVRKRLHKALADPHRWASIITLAGYLFSSWDQGTTEFSDATLRSVLRMQAT